MIVLPSFLKRSLLVLLVASLTICCPAWGQTESATISGTITDPTGAVLVGAQLKLTNVETGMTVTSASNSAGLYVFTSVRPGHYRIVVEKQGFSQIALTDLTVNVQDVLSRNFIMKVGAVGESVTVSGDVVAVNTVNATVSTVVDQKFIESIPMNGRSFQSLIQLTPGVVTVPGAMLGGQGEFSVNGQRTETNYYTVDGVSANVGMFTLNQVGGTPAQTTLGTTQSMASVDALQEFRVNTSTYSAEYGRSPGAQIALTTRSGTNTFHGSAFEYFRNDVLDANNWFNNHAGLPKTAERQNDFGGTLGGPIRIPGLYNGKDKTFFFFSYEGMRLAIPQPAVDTYVPDLCLRGAVSACAAGESPAAAAVQPLVNAFPIPNGPNYGDGSALFRRSYSTPSNMNAYSIRIDHDFGQKLRVFGRFADTPSNSFTRSHSNLASGSNNVGDIKVLTIGATSVLSPHLANEFRFNYTKNSGQEDDTLDNYGGATPLTVADVMPGITPPPYRVFAANFFFGGPDGMMSLILGRAANPAHQWNITDSLSYASGRHAVKFGIDYRRQAALVGSLQLFNNFYYFDPSDLVANAATFGTVITYGPPTSGNYTNFSAFAQDEWRVTNRLSLSLGLRWDLNPPPTSNQPSLALTQVTDLATTNVAAAGTPLYQTDYRAFAPRLGVAYGLRQTPGYETVLRGGFGLFYDVGNANALMGAGAGNFSYKSHFGQAFPIPASQQVPPPPDAITAPYGYTTAPDPNLKMPYTLQWNAAVEQQLGNSQKLAVSYVAAGGRKLLQSFINQVPAANPNFLPGAALTLVENRSTSSYNALQVQFQRRLSHGLQALASYTWSHAIDDLSNNGNWSSSIGGTYSELRRGSADFDVRHNFTAALVYDIPGSYANSVAAAVLKHWSVDVRQSARSALPLNVFSGNTILPTGQQVDTLPDVVPGVPVYLSDPMAPGGRVINPAAFTDSTGPMGNEPRNFVRGFVAWQTDVAVQREFPLSERFKLQFRGEFFNLFNHANFGDIYTDWSSSMSPNDAAQFGRAYNTLNQSLGGLNSLYQMGGPRSIQLALRLKF